MPREELNEDGKGNGQEKSRCVHLDPKRDSDDNGRRNTKSNTMEVAEFTRVRGGLTGEPVAVGEPWEGVNLASTVEARTLRAGDSIDVEVGQPFERTFSRTVKIRCAIMNRPTESIRREIPREDVSNFSGSNCAMRSVKTISTK